MHTTDTNTLSDMANSGCNWDGSGHRNSQEVEWELAGLVRRRRLRVIVMLRQSCRCLLFYDATMRIRKLPEDSFMTHSRYSERTSSAVMIEAKELLTVDHRGTRA